MSKSDVILKRTMGKAAGNNVNCIVLIVALPEKK